MQVGAWHAKRGDAFNRLVCLTLPMDSNGIRALVGRVSRECA